MKLRPDLDHIKPLTELPIPNNQQELCSAIHLFAHYAKWILKNSNKNKPQVEAKIFLNDKVVDSLKILKI